jgi:hypothetical protein
LDLTPGAFPGYSLLTAFGQATPLNLEYQRAGRVLPFPFHFLNNNQAMNVRPQNSSWPDFYDRFIDLPRYSFSWGALLGRFRATAGLAPRWMNLLRAFSTEGFGRLNSHRAIRRRLDADRQFRPYFEQETTELPRFDVTLVRRDLGPLWRWLPEGALYHDSNAYLASEQGRLGPQRDMTHAAGGAEGGGHKPQRGARLADAVKRAASHRGGPSRQRGDLLWRASRPRTYAARRSSWRLTPRATRTGW